MTNIISKIINFLSIEFTVMLTAALPIIELRGAIPVGISLGLAPIHSAVIAFIGSMIPVPFILFLVRPIFGYLKKTKLFKNIIDRTINKSMRKSLRVTKYKYLGLLIFVAIPLPGTGVWTGSTIAALLNMRFKYAFPSIMMGNLIAGTIVLWLSRGVFTIIF